MNMLKFQAGLIIAMMHAGVLSSSTNLVEKRELEKFYLMHCSAPSDIREHLPHLRVLSSQCSSVVEIGIRTMVSTWAILQGLSESRAEKPTYIGIDLEFPPWDALVKAHALAQSQGIEFKFLQGNDMDLDIPEAEMLFIDSLHTYCHLTFELEKFSGKITKYIAMHDTSAPWGEADDTEYHGNYSEYDSSFDRTKRGLWPAVVDFLKRHPEWKLFERLHNCHGFTILKRVESES